MADEDDDETHPVKLAIDNFFAEQEVEKWSIRRPWDLKEVPEEEDSKQPSKKVKIDAIDNTRTSASIPLSSESWFQVASFLDPHDIDSLAVSWKVPYSALRYPTRTTTTTTTTTSTNSTTYNNSTTIASSSSGTTTTTTTTTLPALQVRLESVFRYFSIFKLYADQLQKLEYNWVDIVKLFTGVAKYMQYKYGATFEVHPIHRALVAEGILERLCNNDGNDYRGAGFLPILDSYGPNSSGDISGHFQTDAIKVSLNRVPVPTASTTDSTTNDTNYDYYDPISNVQQNNTIYGSEWVISLGDPSQLRNTKDPENFMNTWLETAQEKHLRDPKVHYTFAERNAILERRCPVVWLFDWPGDSNGYEVGITVDDDNYQTKFQNWSPYYGEYGHAPRFWQSGGPGCGEGEALKSVAHYVLLYPGVYMDGETLGPGQRLMRLAWLQAHGFSLCTSHGNKNDSNNDNNSNNDDSNIIIKDWQAAILSIQEDDDEEQGLDIPVEVVHANVKAMMIDNNKLLRLAKSTDYSLESYV